MEAKKDTCRIPLHNKVWKERFDFIELTPGPRSSGFAL
jgi:hypothetical protein